MPGRLTAYAVGAGLAFLPAAVLAQRYAAGRELKDVSKVLERIDDPWPEQANELGEG